jgi:hypothetical protein
MNKLMVWCVGFGFLVYLLLPWLWLFSATTFSLDFKHVFVYVIHVWGVLSIFIFLRSIRSK